MIDIKAIKDKAQSDINKEITEKATVALVGKLRELAHAKQVVANIERSIKDLEASIADGSFVK